MTQKRCYSSTLQLKLNYSEKSSPFSVVQSKVVIVLLLGNVTHSKTFFPSSCIEHVLKYQVKKKNKKTKKTELFKIKVNRLFSLPSVQQCIDQETKGEKTNQVNH